MSKKRNLFKELLQGVDAMQQHRKHKIALRTHEVEEKPTLEVDAALIRDIREWLNVSRSVFASRLRVAARTLENWEQGRAKPNARQQHLF